MWRGRPYSPKVPKKRRMKNPQGCVALLQVAPIFLKALKPKETDFTPQTLGEHFRKHRLMLHLNQKEAGVRLGVTPQTVLHREKGQTEPQLSRCPRSCGSWGTTPSRNQGLCQNAFSPNAGRWGGRLKKPPGTWGWTRGHGKRGNTETGTGSSIPRVTGRVDPWRNEGPVEPIAPAAIDP